MTSKGQITVPIAVRNDLGLQAGVRVRFVKRADGAYELRPASSPSASLKGFFGRWDGPTLTVDQMNEGIAEAAAEANR